MSFLSCFSSKPSRDASKQQKAVEPESVYKAPSKKQVPVIPVGQSDSDHTDELTDTKDLSGFDTAREEPVAKPSATAMVSTQPSQQKPSRYPAAKQHDPSIRFVKELPKHPEYRKEIASIISKGTDDEGLSQHLVAYINDHGFSLPSLAALTAAIQSERSTDLLVWASRYNLFVLWSADREHPWDSLKNSDSIAATLEIGKAEFEDEVVVLLDGAVVKSWDFRNGVFSTKEPVPWTTPSGNTVLVDLSLKFGTFFGYTKEAGESLTATDVGSQSYLGTQCHGVMWAAETDLPHGWPVAPPIVAGKVNIASRAAALSPGATDPLATFEGTYATHYLPNTQGKKIANKGPELVISVTDGNTDVLCNGVRIDAWAFNPNNVLSWEDSAGHTAWLLFMALPGGPLILGNVITPEQSAPSNFSIFGELKSQPSRLTPNEEMNAVMGHKVAIGLQIAATLLLGEILDTTEGIYKVSGSSSKAIGNGIANGSPAPGISAEGLLKHKLDTFHQVEDLSELFARTFLSSRLEGGLDIHHDIAPQLAEEVYQSCRDARAQMEVAANSAESAERDAADTEEADRAKNVAQATYKASQASMRSQEAAEAAAAAEKLALEAAEHSKRAGTAQAFDHALAAAQAFNQARLHASFAARAERRAASAALTQVEAGISYHAQLKNFDKLREVASASSIATKVLSLATTAVEGWETNTAASRLSALQAARAASSEAQECHKNTRRMQPVQQIENVAYETPTTPK